MQRIWRNKPSKELVELMEQSVDLRLYLIQEKGPLSFLFQDEHRKKYSIGIGGDISCSCGGGKKEHCIHTIYVLNRIFKIEFTDALILQLNFTDAEISKMLVNRSTQNKENLKIKLKNTNSPNQIEARNETYTHKMSLSDDVTCSICQEDMYTIEGLFNCSNSCGHHFHLNCLRIWADHKKASSDLISCPMCRAEWDESELRKSILKNFAQRVAIKPHRGINCNTCDRKNIKGERFHCLICENFDICIECFNLKKHDENHFYLIKKNSGEKWLGVEYNNNNMTDINKYILKNIKLSQFLISLLKDYEKKNEENFEEIQESDLRDSHSNNKCIVCKSERSSSLTLLKFKRLLRCNHLIHFKCAENLFKFQLNKNNEYMVDCNFNSCKFDDLEIFPGLGSLRFPKLKENLLEIEQSKHITAELTNPISKLVINQIKGKAYNSNLNNLQIKHHNLKNVNQIGYQKNSLIKLRTASHSHRNNVNNIQINCEHNLDLALNIQKLDFNYENNIHKYEKCETEEIKKKRVEMRKNYSSKAKSKKSYLIREINDNNFLSLKNQILDFKGDFISRSEEVDQENIVKNPKVPQKTIGVKSINLKSIPFKVYN